MNPPIYQGMVVEAVVTCFRAARRARSEPSRQRLVKRADQIERGVCPPWRTDPTIPCGYSGVTFKDPLAGTVAEHVRSVIDNFVANLPRCPEDRWAQQS